MPETLSQNQIDDLLKRMQSGDMEEESAHEEKVKEYDFASPKKFTKDQLKSLNNLNENFSRVLSSYFTTSLRSICEVTINEIEEQRYSEFNNALPDNTLVGMISFKPQNYDESTLMFEFPTSFGYLLTDRLMGGSGKLYVPERDYTEVELALLNHILTNVTKFMEESWGHFFPLHTELRNIETNGRLIQVFAPQDIVVIVTMEIKEENFSGTANLCMPAENLEKIINDFSVKYARAVHQENPEKEKAKQKAMFDYLKQSDLEVEAILDNCKMDLADISQLQKNDVVVLNKRYDEDLEINVEGIPWFTGRLGALNSRKAIKIVQSTDYIEK